MLVRAHARCWVCLQSFAVHLDDLTQRGGLEFFLSIFCFQTFHWPLPLKGVSQVELLTKAGGAHYLPLLRGSQAGDARLAAIAPVKTELQPELGPEPRWSPLLLTARGGGHDLEC